MLDSKKQIRAVRHFLGDTRGAEMLETVAKVAFIALPILAIFLYTLKTFNTKYTSEGNRVSSQRNGADTATNSAITSLGN